MSETNIVQAIRMRASELGYRLWRNNTGSLEDKRGRWVRFGLCEGSSDLIGISPDGKFVAIEVKTPGKKPTPKQEAFLYAVSAMGGIAGCAHSVEEFEQIISQQEKRR